MRRREVGRPLLWAACALLVVVGLCVGFQPEGTRTAFDGSFVYDGFARFAKVMILFGAAAALALSHEYLDEGRADEVRVPGADRALGGRHDDHGLGARPDRALHGARAAVAGALCRRLLPPRLAALDRGGAQVLRARGAELGAAALRREPDLRLYRDHELPGIAETIGVGPLSLGLVFGLVFLSAGHRVQGLGRAVPHVDARRLRGLADAGDRVLRDGAQGGGGGDVRAGRCSTPSAARSATGSRSWRCSRSPRCSSARSRRSASATSSG